MGIKIIKFIIISLTFFSNTIYSQTIEDKIKYLKKYAYCSCVYINNTNVDETYLNDKSEYLLTDLGKISDTESTKIREFTEKQTKNFTVLESSYHSETGKSNTITADCLNFYESKELDNYVKKILGIKSKKQSVKKKK